MAMGAAMTRAWRRVPVSIAVSIGMLTGREVFRETPMAALREA